MRTCLILASVLLLGFSLWAQSETTAAPETGYISPDQYTNAYFGFKLPLPNSIALGPSSGNLSIQKPDLPARLLFGGMARGAVLTYIAVAALERHNADFESARQEIKLSDAKKILIDGRPFWKGVLTKKGPAGKMQAFVYTTNVTGHVLRFEFVTFDKKHAQLLAQSIESLKFFDPSKAREIAGPNAVPYAAGPRRVAVVENWEIEPGKVSGNTYTNYTLGVEFQFPAGWVVADDETAEKVASAGHEFMYGDSSQAKLEHKLASQCTRKLLYATKYPAGTKDSNPMLLFMAVNPDCGNVPFPRSLDDDEAIQRVSEQVVRQLATQLPFPAEQKVRALMVQGHVMLELSVDLKLKVPQKKEPIAMHGSFLLTEVNHTIVVWMSQAFTPEQLDEVHSLKVSLR